MISVQGHGHPRRERPSDALSVTPFVALFDSSPPLELGDELSNQPVRPLGTKPPVADTFVVTSNVPKHSENDLQRIFQVVLEA